MATKPTRTAMGISDDDFELPLVKCTKMDVFNALFVHHPADEPYKDGLLKLQTWILNFAEEQVKPLRESELFTEDQVEEIKKKYSVISPITLTLYTHWLQMEQFIKMTDSEKEKHMLERLPDRFKARFRGNAACRSAREETPDEEAAKAAMESEEETRPPLNIEQVIKDLQSDNPPDYIKRFIEGM